MTFLYGRRSLIGSSISYVRKPIRLLVFRMIGRRVIRYLFRIPISSRVIPPITFHVTRGSYFSIRHRLARQFKKLYLLPIREFFSSNARYAMGQFYVAVVRSIFQMFRQTTTDPMVLDRFFRH